MMRAKNNYKWISLLLIVVMVILPFNQLQAVNEIFVEITKETPVIILSNEGERVFDIGYEFDVSYEAITTGLDVVLVLDRSNSMLRLDPSTNLPVADAVWNAVNVFVTEVYTAYPESNVAIVSFGTNGNKSDNWKYFDNLEDTLDEIEEVYDYRDLYSNYHSNFRSYWNNGYRYAWENWQITDGATNIHAAFDYAARTVEMKQTVTKDNDQNVIILFTDGVATQGGSNSQRNYNYPTSHNTNTIAAYEAGIEAQTVAEILTVGYFEGIEYESTKNIARETLELSQNAGLFEASQTGQLTSIFDTIVEELNYIGTDAVVTETIEDEFEVVFDSIQPEDYEMTTDGEGRTVITWPLGNVVDAGYEFGYQVRVKDDVYPTGSGTVKIPINLDATLSYTDLEGNLVVESLGHNEVSIPPRGNQPLVNVDVLYDDGVFGYLVGDPIHMIHDMSFINEAPFDYRNIVVDDLTKTIDGGNYGTRLVLSDISIEDGWQLIGDNLVYGVNEEKAALGEENLEWTHQVDLTLTPLQAGNYTLASNIDYTLTNSVDLEFEFANSKQDPSAIGVREGVLMIDFIDVNGQIVYNIPVKVDGSYSAPYVYNGIHEYKGITSGTHEVEFKLPSGYALDASNTGITLDDENYVTFNFDVSYDTPTFEKVIEFEVLDVKDIEVTDREGDDYIPLTQLVQDNEVLVTFTLVNDLDKVVMNLVDDYTLANHTFVLDILDSENWVLNSEGDVIEGFVMDGNKLSYDGPTLSAGTYTAYGIISTPDQFGDDLDYTFYVEVDEITTRTPSATEDTIKSTTSEGLTLGIIDNDAPIVEATFLEENSTSNVGNFELEVSDLINIAEVAIYEGELELGEINEETLAIEFEIEEDLGYYKLLLVDVPLDVLLVDDQFESLGYATIYVRDEIGNEDVYVLTVDSRSDYTDLQ